jgi:hypothetical protein
MRNEQTINKVRSYFFVFLILFSFFASGSFQFPRNLGPRDRDRITEIIGLGNSTKLTSNPYPLGGYSGVELSYSVEQINTEDVGRLGATSTNTQKDFSYSRLSLGKGLYNNLDLFINFIPYSEVVGYSEYGGFLRWCFYQAAFIPASFSLILHANSSNIGNEYFSQTRGIDMTSGLNVGNLSLYVGVGEVWATGLFSQSINAIDASGTIHDERTYLTSLHTFVGGAFDMEPYFMALQVDQYTQTTFSGKVGLRF